MVVVANNIAVVVVVVLVTSVVYREVANGDDMSTSGGCFLRIMPAVHIVRFHQYLPSLVGTRNLVVSVGSQETSV